LSEGEVIGVIEFFSNLVREPDEDLLEMMASIGALAGQVVERLRAEDELREALRGLKEADQRKDEFLAMLAHELRNPLAPIRNALELLTPDAGQEMTQWAINLMQRQVQHMVRLVDDLLDVSRVMRGKIQLKMQPVDVGLAVRHAIEEAWPAIEAQQQML